MSRSTKIDRAALVRRAVVELVAENGFRGTSMAAVAAHAGVATGTAYVHYSSKDELVVAAYVEVKSALGLTGVEAIENASSPETVFGLVWHAMYRHLAADPVQARFLVQVQASPYAARAHEAALGQDALADHPALADLFAELVDLPPLLLYDLGLGPAIRLAATDGLSMTDDQLKEVAAACWRSVSGC